MKLFYWIRTKIWYLFKLKVICTYSTARLSRDSWPAFSRTYSMLIWFFLVSYLSIERGRHCHRTWTSSQHKFPLIYYLVQNIFYIILMEVFYEVLYLSIQNFILVLICASRKFGSSFNLINSVPIFPYIVRPNLFWKHFLSVYYFLSGLDWIIFWTLYTFFYWLKCPVFTLGNDIHHSFSLLSALDRIYLKQFNRI